ncbi:MAG: LuxR C-terminal-related transcriptional regulator [Porphyromonas sp.]|nr:LuxR C-terminal-related transcriptional regulator [Porphyromonas sp.]
MRRLRVALVMTDTLRREGLNACIREVTEKVLVEHHESFASYAKADDFTPYDIAIIESNHAALFRDYFRTRRTHLVVLTEGVQYEPIEGVSETVVLDTKVSLSEILIQLQELFDDYRRRQESNLDRTLSPREIDVLKEVALGKTNKEIADELNISMNTVMSHRKNITSKLNIKTVSGLTFYALMNGIISGDELID